MYTYDAKIRVRYGETDKMGIVYYANYLNWFEIGRTEFFRSLGMTYKELEDNKIMLPVIETNCKYIWSAEYDDVIIIRTRIDFLKGTRIRFAYDIIRENNNRLLAQGMTEHPFTTLDKKPVNIKKVLPHVYEMLNKCYGDR
ncbi:thioesterase family protein [Thermoanaerobacterium thermosaccharolyticum]|uniref:Thioesterase superfamily protein n=1 Tax=Thermoanaerobacterium thermosaccharolyticum (strain ATCC 7956 / DSM 571 / NCIMB 9385 / NCA 3814 / NCTC 13789 / WDCM 00135 / 2032) TaxID=580327 RepID=D9TLK1_THETC|nr:MULTISPECIES: thioesterase family protein [Thermoanaerobacterium]ADL68326.1 thioesterase superfamily protein [Thermoanaerobacterium thermosaccharolyticum DSM 571]WHE06233.1 thioesterase family protein [Thermoanaerobacterium thermosaccharolyticum]WKV08370.1 thioesterase family protein [Thermoanaerobacterium sp. CMT5567-10]